MRVKVKKLNVGPLPRKKRDNKLRFLKLGDDARKIEIAKKLEKEKK